VQLKVFVKLFGIQIRRARYPYVQLPQHPSTMAYTIPLLINGKEKTSTSTFPVESPVSHTTLWSCSSASSDDVDAALAAASAVFPAWSKTKPGERRTILLKAADLLEQRAEELKLHLQQETGATEAFASFNIATTAELFRDTAGRCSTIAGSIPVCQEEGTSALILKEPYGVVLAIAPWYVRENRSTILLIIQFYAGTRHTSSASGP
jgi:acyl-CoA reductase-like NAD-dependent aldehyde dehydrogenase